MEIRNPSIVLFGLTLGKSLDLPNLFPPKKAKESIITLIKTMINKVALFVMSAPKCLRTNSSWEIKKYKDAKNPKWIATPEVSQIKFLCKKVLLTGKLMIRKNNPI